MKIDKKLEAIIENFAYAMRHANPAYIANGPEKKFTLDMDNVWYEYILHMQRKCKKSIHYQQFEVYK